MRPQFHYKIQCKDPWSNITSHKNDPNCTFTDYRLNGKRQHWYQISTISISKLNWCILDENTRGEKKKKLKCWDEMIENLKIYLQEFKLFKVQHENWRNYMSACDVILLREGVRCYYIVSKWTSAKPDRNNKHYIQPSFLSILATFGL